jgi:hypothetical protein
LSDFDSAAKSMVFMSAPSCTTAAAAYHRFTPFSSIREKQGGSLGKRVEVTCQDCYFHKAGLCALLLERPCPTFRHAERGVLDPPRQPQLVPRPLSAFARGAAAA